MLEALLLLSVPLFLRWITAWKMRQLRVLALNREEELRVLQNELDGLLDRSRQAGQITRQYASKRLRLQEDIDANRDELLALRDPTAGRIAA